MQGCEEEEQSLDHSKNLDYPSPPISPQPTNGGFYTSIDHDAKAHFRCESKQRFLFSTVVVYLTNDLVGGIAKCTTSSSSGIHVLHKILNFSISTVVCISGWRFIHSSNIVSNFEYNK
jgi:hypothetical protein